jgi:uncharacterized protein YjiS (DUF1127 family)
MNRLALAAIRQLLRFGEAAASDLNGFEHLRGLGVFRPSEDGKRAVATTTLVKMLRLLGQKEAEAGVFALYPEIQPSWIGIVCARVEEMGIRRDAQALFDAIDRLGAAANAAVEAWEKRSLDPTPFTALEREILGAPAPEAVSAPILLRAISAAGAVLSDDTARGVSSLPDVHEQDPGGNWVKGRILLPPGVEPVDEVSAVLSGSLAPIKNEQSGAPMPWVLARPWIFLMGQLVFMQEAWQAERISGRLALELDREQLSTFHQPAQVSVVVTMPDGAEVQCGTLGELIARALEDLGIALLTADASKEAMDAMVSPVIHTLLTNEIWTFESGSTGEKPGYRIHPIFSDLCYRTLGSRLFYRKGGPVTMSLRRTCEEWAKERLARARLVSEEGVLVE